MRNNDVKARLRKEQDILDRLENVKRLIQMETTLLTSNGAELFGIYCLVNGEGKRARSHVYNLLQDLREEIQLQLLSITALCYGDSPDVGEPIPMLEWKDDNEENSEDIFRETWDKCLGWNA